MPEVAIVVLMIAFPATGVFTRRWIAVALPIVGWPLYFLGLTQGWWGYGTGDGWQYGAMLLTAFGVLTTGIAVALARSVRAHASSGVSRGRRRHAPP